MVRLSVSSDGASSARAIEAPWLDTLSRTITETAPKHGPENALACLEGYRAVGEQLQRAAA